MCLRNSLANCAKTRTVPTSITQSRTVCASRRSWNANQFPARSNIAATAMSTLSVFICVPLSDRANRNVISIQIPERELPRARVRVHVRLLFEAGDERARPVKCPVEIVDAEEQEEPVARRPLVRTHQRGMLVCAPLVEAEQDGSIRIPDLTKVVMFWSSLGLPKERLVPLEASGDVAYAND